jgi:transposase-like protein
MFESNRTRPFLIRYALYLYLFSWVKSWKFIETIKPSEERSCVVTWYWIQEFNPKNVLPNKNGRMNAFIICEIAALIEDTDAWLWVATQPIHNKIFGVFISRHRNMLVAEAFLGSLVKLYGKHIVYYDGRTWCPEACSSLGLTRTLHSMFKKGIIERAVIGRRKIELNASIISITV